MIISKRNPTFINKAPTTFQAGDTAGLAMWVKQRQAEGSQDKLVEGRIIDTGSNYVVEGYQGEGLTWVRIPCRRLLDARLLLGSVMPKEDFEWIAELERSLP